MPLQFTIKGSPPGGGGRVKYLPVFDITDWRLVRHDADSLVYKPTAATVARRLLWTLFAGIVMAAIHWGFTDRANLESLFRMPAHYLDWVYQGLMAFFAAVAILAPLSCLWNVVSLTRDPRGRLIVTRRMLRTTTLRWPAQCLTGITIACMEQTSRTRGGTRIPLGWQWQVQAARRVEADPETQRLPWELEIAVDKQKHAPADVRHLPERVRTFVAWLHAATGAPVDEPQLVPWGHPRRTAVNRQEFVSPGASQVNSQRFASLDDAPPEIRERIEAMLAERGIDELPVNKPLSMSSQAITFKDASGNVRTYNSPDDMPPDLRAIYERARKERQ
jgi:hypothetical protein